MQSPSCEHASPGPQASQSGPPQSTPVSDAFFTPSTQLAGTQLPPAQTPLAQSEATTHSTHAPAPSQTAPPSVSQGEPAGAMALVGTPASQASTVQASSSSGASLSSISDMTAPDPSHTSAWQSPVT